MLNSIILNIYLISLLVVGIFSLEAIYLAFRFLSSGKVKKDQNLQNYTPRVTVQLPIYNELYVARRLIHAVSNLDYPRDLLEIQVLDDSTDDTKSICLDEVSRLQNAGFNIVHIHRNNRSGFKAGALRNGLAKATSVALGHFVINNSHGWFNHTLNLLVPSDGTFPSHGKGGKIPLGSSLSLMGLNTW